MSAHLAPPHRPQAGQAVPLVLVALVFASLAAAGLVRVSSAARERAAVHAAADAAALAGAAEGRAAAQRVAEADGARLVAFHQVGDDVIVTVARGAVEAEARARWVADDGAGLGVAGP